MFCANPNIQIASTMQQFQCDLPRMTCKTQAESQNSTAEQLHFDQRWRNHSTAVCRHWVETRHRITTHYCRTHCLDAAVPMHKASQHMQNTIAQHQQRKEKVTWNHQFHCARKTNRNRRQSGRPQASRAREWTFLRNASSVYQKKSFVQIPRYKSHPWCSSSNAICPRMACKTQWESQDSTAEQLPFDQRWCNIPRRSADTELQHTVGLQHTTVEHIAWMQQFQCTKLLNTCKTQKHSVNKEKKKSPGTISSTARAKRTGIDGKADARNRRARVSQLFSATEAPLTQNNNVACKS